MSLLAELRDLFDTPLSKFESDAAKRATLLSMIRPNTNVADVDYQANFAMSLAKQLGMKPQPLADEIVMLLPQNSVIKSASVAGAGFINVTLSADGLAKRIHDVASDDKLGLKPSSVSKRVIIDYSGPNVAKPLHVGHLRSTIIGDSIVRILRAIGHYVTGDNHLGDWGTQFGILIYGYKNYLDAESYRRDPVRELARLYVKVRKLFAKPNAEDDDAPVDDPVADACRRETAKLHAGDPENVALWHQFMPACLKMLEPLYKRLDVKIDLAHGESFYNPMLASVVDELLQKGLASESAGAVVIPNANGVTLKPGEVKKGEEPPALIRKRDGAFTYTTTDLATVKYRAEELKPDVSLYVVDARQALHFKTIFAAARRWGYTEADYVHVAFGSILGEDRKPLRTRDGNVYELETLLDEAVTAAGKNYEQSCMQRAAAGHKLAELSPREIADIAEVTGVGAVKYADLASNRATDYVFSLERMLSPDGNTATYMQYAYARCRAIFRKGEVDEKPFRDGSKPVTLTDPTERALALAILRYPDAIHAAAASYEPHIVIACLWDVGKSLSAFYESCPVLTAPTAESRASRLQLVDLAGRVIKNGLGLLGINTVEQM